MGLSFLKPAWCISNDPLENMPSGVEQSKQISGNSLSSSSVICGSMVQVLSTSPWLSRTMDPLEQQASSARPVKPCSPIGNVERPVAGTTCRPASVSSRMARRMVPSASCRAFSSVPSKSLANILIMGHASPSSARYFRRKRGVPMQGCSNAPGHSLPQSNGAPAR